MKLKSEAVKIADYRDYDISQYVGGFEVDEGLIEKDINRLLNKNGKRIEAQKVQKDDLVVLSCQSDEPKYNKKSITVSIGKGLFSKELEEKLIGLEVGKEYSIDVSDTMVTVRIEKITRVLLPKLTDETAALWGIEGVTDLKSLRKYCISKQIAAFLLDCEAADEASAYLWQQVSNNSVIYLDEGEKAEMLTKAARKISEIFGQEGSEDDKDLLEELFLTGLKSAVIGQKTAETENRLLTRDDYENYLHKMMDCQEGLTREQAEEKYPLLDYLIDEYGDINSKKIDEYVAECFNNILNP